MGDTATPMDLTRCCHLVSPKTIHILASCGDRTGSCLFFVCWRVHFCTNSGAFWLHPFCSSCFALAPICIGERSHCFFRIMPNFAMFRWTLHPTTRALFDFTDQHWIDGKHIWLYFLPCRPLPTSWQIRMCSPFVNHYFIWMPMRSSTLVITTWSGW